MMSFARKIFLLAAAGVAVRAAEPASLTLEQALGAVETANITALLGREAVAQALELANQQRVGVLPNVALSAQQRRAQAVALAGGVPVQGVAANRFDGKLTGSYAVLDPVRRSALRASRVGAEVAEHDYRAILQGVQAGVAAGYFTHLRNLRRLDVLEANIARARALLDLAQNQLKAGVATQIDVTRAEAQLALTEQARLQQETVIVQGAQALRRLLGLPGGGELRLADFAVRRAGAVGFTAFEEKTNFERRADWLRAAKALEQSQLDVRTAKFGRLPALALGGEYGLVSGEVFDGGKKEAWFAGATITVPVFDGLKNGADQRAALSRQRAQDLRLKNLELQISSELRVATQDASSRNAQITVAEKSLRLAEEELKLARVRFEKGAADNREIVEAQNRLAIAGDNLVEAVYQYNLSRVELARAKGEVRAILAEKTE